MIAPGLKESSSSFRQCFPLIWGLPFCNAASTSPYLVPTYSLFHTSPCPPLLRLLPFPLWPASWTSSFHLQLLYSLAYITGFPSLHMSIPPQPLLPHLLCICRNFH